MHDFFSQFKSQAYKKADVIIDPEITPPGLFYLESGLVRQFVVTQDGEELTLNTYKPETFFPVGFVINDTPVIHYYEAQIDSVVRIAPKPEAVKFLKTHPEVVYDLMQRVYRGLDGYFVKMAQALAGSASSKLVTELLTLNKRFGSTLKINESELANQLGLARETVSREINKLIGLELITFTKGTIVIRDTEKLEKLLIY